VGKSESQREFHHPCRGFGKLAHSQLDKQVRCGIQPARRALDLAGDQQYKTREVFRIVLDGFRENYAAIPSCSLASCDASGGLVTACEDVADTASGVFCGNTLQLRVRKKKPFTLSERHGMRSDGFQTVKSCAWAADQMMLDREDDFRDDFQVAFQQKVVNANDRPGK